MSFAAKVKEELASKWDFRPCCYKAELAGIIDTIGTLTLSSLGLSLHMITQSGRIANRIYRLVSEKMHFKAEVYSRQEERLYKVNSYLVAVNGTEQVQELLRQLGKDEHMLLNSHSISDQVIQWDCCRHSYLRGVFLATGSLSDPIKKTYHLELITHWPEHAVQLCNLLDQHELNPHIIERKGSQVVYLKDSNCISDFLTMIGAINSMLEYENTRVLKETRNAINRTTNCEMANMDKIIEASLQQCAYISWLERHGALSRLSPGLIQAAEGRLDHSNLSLKELGERLGISKSALNHRLRKLREFALEEGWQGEMEQEIDPDAEEEDVEC